VIRFNNLFKTILTRLGQEVLAAGGLATIVFMAS